MDREELPPGRVHVGWKIARAILTAVAFLVVTSLPLWALASLNAEFHPEFAWAAVPSLLFVVMVIGAVQVGWLGRFVESLSAHQVRLRFPPLRAWPLLAPVIVLGAFSLWLLGATASGGFSENGATSDFGLPEALFSLHLFVGSALAPSIFEELAIRGVVQGQLEDEIGAPWALLVSSAAFCAIHVPVDLGACLYYLAWGAFLGFLFWVTDSLVPSILVHLVTDTSAFFFVPAGSALYGGAGRTAAFLVAALVLILSTRARLRRLCREV